MPGTPKNTADEVADSDVSPVGATASSPYAAELSALPADVRDVVRGWLEHPRQAARGRSALYGCRAARDQGLEVQGFGARGLIHVKGEGGAALLGPLAFKTRVHEAGAPEDQVRLRRALEGAVGDRRYVLHIRRPLPTGFDPAPVVQAVSLWEHARRRGEYLGLDAIYEDEGVHIELALTGVERHENDPALLLQANPIPGLERMSVVGSILLRLAALHAQVKHLGPLVPVLTAEPAWRLSRGHAEQVLYGTAQSVEAVTGSRPSYRAVHEREHGLFGEKTCRHLAAVWWLEPQGAGVRGWAHENPWCVDRKRAPKYPGPRYAVGDSLEGQRYQMTWTT